MTQKVYTLKPNSPAPTRLKHIYTPSYAQAHSLIYVANYLSNSVPVFQQLYTTRELLLPLIITILSCFLYI